MWPRTSSSFPSLLPYSEEGHAQLTPNGSGGETRKNWWRERGLGDIKVLTHKVEKTSRLLMRQEKTLKICLNHLVDPKTELKPMAGAEGKAWTFRAADFADGEKVKVEQFAIKFGQVDTANKFKEAFEGARNNNRVKKGGAAAPSPAPAPAPAAAAPVAAAKPTATAAAAALADNVSKLSVSPAPAPAPTQPAPQTPQPPQPPMVGSFKARDPNDPEVRAAAEFAAKSIGMGELVRVASAKVQVVAGLIYKLALHIRYKDGKLHAHVATVFQPLPHTKQPLRLEEEVHTGVLDA